MDQITASIPAGAVEYSLDDAAVDIDDLIAQLQDAKEDGATRVVGLSGNYRGAKYVRLGSVSIEEDYSSSLSARIAQLQADEVPEGDSPDDYTTWAGEKAEEIRELADEKRESAFADELRQWADKLEAVDVPDLPDPEDADEDEDEDALLDEWRDNARSAVEDILNESLF